MAPVKSPSSPSRPLADCFDEGMKLYDAYPNASFDQAQIASVLGLSVSSGFFKSLLSDIKQYGLIEKNTSEGFVISPTLKEYSIATDSEKQLIRYELAVRPKVFSQILENQGNHLPAESTLADVLTARFSFNKARAIKAAKALRRSLEWAGAIDAKGNVVKPSANADDTSNTSDIPEVEESAKTTPGMKSGEAALTIASNYLIAEVSVGDSRKVRIEYPHDLTEAEASRVGNVLIALGQTE